jgi:putative Mg2+ transporter-C (MgtC) family protein
MSNKLQNEFTPYSTRCGPGPGAGGGSGQQTTKKKNSASSSSVKHSFQEYFTEYTPSKGIFYIVLLVYVCAVCVVVAMELILSDSTVCGAYGTAELAKDETIAAAANATYENVLYHYQPCMHYRSSALLFLTRTECSFGRRLLASVLLGSVIGWERREADRPAGIRTMALVSLGACLFSINSAFAFLDGPMAWDSSRVAAAIPSGVGFLGAGLIFKEAQKDNKTGDTMHVVHGLTTSASLWIVRSAYDFWFWFRKTALFLCTFGF